MKCSTTMQSEIKVDEGKKIVGMVVAQIDEDLVHFNISINITDKEGLNDYLDEAKQQLKNSIQEIKEKSVGIGWQLLKL